MEAEYRNELHTQQALKLLSLGYPVIPLAGKVPLPKKWKPYSTSMEMTEADVEKWWTTYGGANIGLLTKGLVVVDTDSEMSTEWAMANLPKTPMAVKTTKGAHFYYRRGDKCVARNTQNRSTEIDVRTTGGYSVAPPSVHPDSKLDYQWMTFTGQTDVPSAGPVAHTELPELPNQYIEFLQSTKGSESQEERPSLDLSKYNSDSPEIGDTFLFRYGAKLRGDGSYGDDDILKEMRKINSRLTNPMDEERLNKCWKQALKYDRGPEFPSVDERVEVEKLTFPKELLRPPGLAGEIADMINSNARYPQPILTIGATLAMLGSVYGQKIRGETDVRTNFFGVGIAESGAGKDNARQCIKKILSSVGMTDNLGGEDLASDGGLFSAMMRCPSSIFLLDEIGRMFNTMTGKAAPAHMVNIITMIMRMYSSSTTMVRGKEYANQKDRPRQDIDQPCMNLWGTTVPSAFFKSLNGDDVIGGMMSRMSYFFSEDDNPPKRDIGIIEVPYSIQAQLKAINELPRSPGGILDTVIAPQIIKQDTLARERFKLFEALAAKKKAEYSGDTCRSFWTRAEEHVLKVSLILAGPSEITIDEMHYACELVAFQSNQICEKTKNLVSDNEIEGNVKKVLAIIRAAGKDGIQRRDLSRKTQGFSTASRKDIIETLKISEQITCAKKAGSGRPTEVYYAMEY